MAFSGNLFSRHGGRGGIIEITPELVRDVAQQIEHAFVNIESQLDIVQSNVAALSDVEFDGRAADAFRTQYVTETRNLKEMILLLQDFRNYLLGAADKFEEADLRLSGTGTSMGEASPPAEAPQSPASNSAPAPQPAVSSGQIGTDRIVTHLDEMGVANNAKYLPRDGKTYCNIFASDFATDMGAKIPQMLTVNGSIDYLDANEMVRWMAGEYPHDVPQGTEVGWHQTSTADAAQYAQDGYVVVAGGGGHMAIVRPESQPTGRLEDIRIDQAGGRNFQNGPLLNGFGSVRNQVRFFVYKP